MTFISKSLNRKLAFSWLNMRHNSTQSKMQEVRVPTTLGYLAGKWWGPTDKRPILALHGWQDSCGTFDRLIPLLPKHIPILAIDSPGHGFSYKLPAGIAYRNSDSPIMIKEIIKYFGWNKITLMGHSLGAILSYTYGFLFPNDVDYIICIDGLHPLITPKGMQRVVRSLEEFMKYDELQRSNQEPPSYTIEEMIQRIHLGTRKSIVLETAKYIICRNIAPSKNHPGKYYFNRDARLKVGPLVCEDPAQIIASASNINFPIFISKADGSPFFGNETMFKDVFEIVKKTSADCQFHQISGTHHVHLNEPEILAGLITKFIERYHKGDRGNSGFKNEIIYNDLDCEKMQAVAKL